MYNHNIETPLVRSTSKENMCDSQREDDRHDENVEEKQQQPATTASTCTRPSSSPPSQMDGVQKCDRSRARRKTDNHRLHMVLSQRRLLYAGVHQNLFGIHSVSGDCHRVTYDPVIHCAMWQNDKPFVLHLYNRRIKNAAVVKRRSKTLDSLYVMRN